MNAVEYPFDVLMIACGSFTVASWAFGVAVGYLVSTANDRTAASLASSNFLIATVFSDPFGNVFSRKCAMSWNSFDNFAKCGGRWV